MGTDFVVSFRSSSLHGAFAFSVHRALPDSPCVRGAWLAEGLRCRRLQAMAAGGRYSSSTSVPNGDGNCVWKVPRPPPNSIFYQEGDGHLQSCHRDQLLHHGHHHCHTGAYADVSCHSRLGFVAAASGHTLDVNEHVCCEISFLQNCSYCSSMEWEESKVDISRSRGVVAGVGVPLSLRMLKKKQQGLGKASLPSGPVEVGNSLLMAFSSIVFMFKELQSHYLHIQQQSLNQGIEGLLVEVHREMHASFVWLFQQVFSCTPELMVLLMVLLADFAAFSMASSMPIGMTIAASSALSAADIPVIASHVNGSGNLTTSSPSLLDLADPCPDDSGWIGDIGKWTRKGDSDAGNGDCNNFNTFKVSSRLNELFYSAKDHSPPEVSSPGKAVLPLTEKLNIEASNRQMPSEDVFSYEAAALVYEQLSSAEELLSGSSSSDSNPNAQRLCNSRLAGLSNSSSRSHSASQSFVTPFAASVEDDSYTCYDRTDLAYQYAISSDATNSMLLANYAQFLFLVRKDHDRAEELFRRAVQCDPLDGDNIGRFARFLWLARSNVSAAGRAYQAAVCTDPCNSFHAADYAHFLWNSGQ